MMILMMVNHNRSPRRLTQGVKRRTCRGSTLGLLRSLCYHLKNQVLFIGQAHAHIFLVYMYFVGHN